MIVTISSLSNLPLTPAPRVAISILDNSKISVCLPPETVPGVNVPTGTVMVTLVLWSILSFTLLLYVFADCFTLTAKLTVPKTGIVERSPTTLVVSNKEYCTGGRFVVPVTVPVLYVMAVVPTMSVQGTSTLYSIVIPLLALAKALVNVKFTPVLVGVGVTPVETSELNFTPVGSAVWITAPAASGPKTFTLNVLGSPHATTLTGMSKPPILIDWPFVTRPTKNNSKINK